MSKTQFAGLFNFSLLAANDHYNGTAGGYMPHADAGAAHISFYIQTIISYSPAFARPLEP